MYLGFYERIQENLKMSWIHFSCEEIWYLLDLCSSVSLPVDTLKSQIQDYLRQMTPSSVAVLYSTLFELHTRTSLVPRTTRFRYVHLVASLLEAEMPLSTWMLLPTW